MTSNLFSKSIMVPTICLIVYFLNFGQVDSKNDFSPSDLTSALEDNKYIFLEWCPDSNNLIFFQCLGFNHFFKQKCGAEFDCFKESAHEYLRFYSAEELFVNEVYYYFSMSYYVSNKNEFDIVFNLNNAYNGSRTVDLFKLSFSYKDKAWGTTLIELKKPRD